MKNSKKLYILVIVFSIALTVVGFAFGYFTARIKEVNKTKTTVKSGSLELLFTGETEINAENILPGETFTKTFSVENPGSTDMKFNIYLENVENSFEDDLVYSVKQGNELITGSRILPKTKEGKSYLLYELDIQSKEKYNYTFEISFVNKDELQETQGKSFSATLGIDNISADAVAVVNPHITAAYKYDNASGSQTYCVSGTESTCEKTKCVRNIDAGSCEAGTIIQYEINDNEEKFFNVLFDDGETMRLQQTTDTTGEVSFSGYAGSTVGPTEVLRAVTSATASWNNVNNQTFTLGTTVFQNNKYTNCNSYSSCISNLYTMPEQTTKARAITVQEAAALGCTQTAGSCPPWMKRTSGYNSYWTMNTSDSSNAWIIYRDNDLAVFNTVGSWSAAVKAVVVINKN